MRWKVSEEYFLGLNYQNRNIDFEKVLGRKIKTIQEKARKLGISRIKNWSEAEIEILKNNSAYEASNIIDRSFNSCKIKKTRLKYESRTNSRATIIAVMDVR
jgi:hypothetical protein